MHQKKKIWLILAVLCFFLAAGVWYFCCMRESTANETEEKEEIESVFLSLTPEPTQLPEPTAQPRILYVYVCGAVTMPGVYALPEGSRLFEAVALAGGCLPEADEAYHNLARELSDGERVYILSKEESAEFTVMERAEGETLTGTSAGDDGAAKVTGMINLNTATVEQLTELPGIGESRAQDIIAYRNKVGRFLDTKEIMNVSGIGEAMFAKIKDRITVE